jgi:hypothetical protein
MPMYSAQDLRAIPVIPPIVADSVDHSQWQRNNSTAFVTASCPHLGRLVGGATWALPNVQDIATAPRVWQ